jgi:dimeric dUTPase (all-alpha-NTP-PPase superfamily)
MKEQILTMLALQDSMNQRVHPQWRSQGYAWYRAIWVECAELLDHYGWKWWKKQDPDTEQVALELIDIWHFGLSLMLESDKSLDVLSAEIERNITFTVGSGDFRADVEDFAAVVLRDKDFDAAGFARLMGGVNMSFDQLYSGYVGKNVLNFFRQDHGYKDGSYRKTWSGKEDNEHLVEVLMDLDLTSSRFKEDLYEALKVRYLQTA